MKRTTNDHYAEKAKQMGYPARSIFKLEEILDKHPSLIKVDSKVLDLGAAPGSWSLYLAKKKQVEVIACDLKPLTITHPNITMVQGDFTSDNVINKLKSFGLYSLLVCDAAPSTSGDRDVDCAKSHELVDYAIQLADMCVEVGGHIIVKIFTNGDEKEQINTLKAKYTDVKILKPKAVRKESFETYLIGIKRIV